LPQLQLLCFCGRLKSAFNVAYADLLLLLVVVLLVADVSS
jgi:hypothetical protein